MIDLRANSIIYQAQGYLVELVNDLIKDKKLGKVLDSEWDKADLICDYLETYNQVDKLTDPSMINYVLECLIIICNIYAYPVYPDVTTEPLPPIIDAKGDKGDTGATGAKGDTGLATDFQTTVSITSIVDTFNLTDAKAARWDYFVMEIGGAQRAGTVIGHWLQDGSDEAIDDSAAPDLDASTNGIEFDIQITGSTVNLLAIITSGTWNVVGSRYFIPNNGNGSGPVSSVLANGTILIGNSSNQAQSRSVSGAITITNTGVTTLSNGVVLDANIGSGANITLTKLQALTPSKAVVSDVSGYLTSSVTSLAELAFSSGLTSPIQTQLNARLIDPTTSIGDIIIRDGSNIVSRLGIGTAGQILTVSGAIPVWANPTAGFSDPMTTPGDIIIRNAGNVTVRLGIDSDGKVLTLNAGLPSWQSIPTLAVTGGTKYKKSALSNPNTFVTGSPLGGGFNGMLYNAGSFTTPAEVVWKVSVEFQVQLQNQSSVDVVRMTIERSPDNSTWSTLTDFPLQDVTTNNGAPIYVTINGIDTTVVPSTTYYYRLRAYNFISGNNNFFSSNAGYTIHLVPA